MATRTLGSATTTTLTAIPFPNLATGTPADFAAINALILDDTPLLWPSGNVGTAAGQNAAQIAAKQNLIPTAFSNQGLLYVPNRGYLKILPGDWVAVDTFGWPILVSGRSVQSSAASWVHTGNPT